jgi:GT2 family glycosyltransferase
MQPEGPTFSVLVPVYRPQPQLLTKCIESVINQTYPKWELIAVDDGGADPDVIKTLNRLASQDPRIEVHVLDQNMGIGVATQRALDEASNEFVTFLDHDDTLTPDALLLAANWLDRHPDVDFLYGDEDKANRRGRFAEPSFRPARNFDLLYSYNYVSHPVAVRRRAIEAVGGMRAGFDGSQDHDLALRLRDSGAVFGRVPEIIYHWTVSAGSAAGSSLAKPYAYRAGLVAVSDSLKRRGTAARARIGLVPGHYEILHDAPTHTRIGIIVATNQSAGKVLDRLRYLIDPADPGIETTVIVVRSPAAVTSMPEDAMRWPARWSHVRGECVSHEGWPSPASALNTGRRFLDQVDHLAFVDPRVTIVEPLTLRQLVGNLNDSGVGAVGPVALSKKGKIKASGVVIQGGEASIPDAGLRWDAATHHGLSRKLREVSAVQLGLLVTRQQDFDAVGGFSDRFPEKYFDIAYCLLLRSKLEMRVVIDPVFPILMTGPNRLDRQASDYEEVTFSALVHELSPVDDPFHAHNLPQLVPDYPLSSTRP